MSVDIIKGNEIFISESLWSKLNNRFTKEEIKKIIIRNIREHNIPLPYPKISSNCAIKDFQKLLYLDTNELFIEGKTYTRFDYKDEASFYIDQSNIGNKASNYFHQKNRYKCDSLNSPSPVRVWESDKFLDSMLNALWSLKFKKVTNNELHQCILMRKYIASQFKPSVAKAVINYFEADSVLDFSAGWGDRLCGFYASNASSYVGVDPNSNLLDGYKKQMILYSKIHERKKAKIYNACAEDMEYEKDSFDLVFTSPPYFIMERYTGNVLSDGSRDQNQSWVKYNNLDSWLNGFLFKSIENAWNGLKQNGHLAINISDVYARHKVNKIVEPMIEFVATLPQSDYQGQIGMKLSSRPNSGALKDKSGVFIEPIFIWKKL